MRKKLVVIGGVLLFFIAIGLFWWLIKDETVAVLDPKGTIAAQQKDLLIFASALSLIIIVPVFALTFGIVWKYHEGSKRAKYMPNWASSKRAEALWWGIPLILIVILSVVIWISSHSLDPYKPLVSDKKPLTVQVIALQWKWLFIYPEQNIASVNYLHIPVDRPISFELTSDAPMNSFWIPQLGGQVYAMSGMTTKLHLMASEAGTYHGMTANISGKGYADMTFDTKAVAQPDFDEWVLQAQRNGNPLTTTGYDQLASPTEKNPVTIYSSRPSDLYDTVVMKYMMPTSAEGMTHDTHAH